MSKKRKPKTLNCNFAFCFNDDIRAKIISSSRNDQEGLGQTIGTMFIAAGIVQLGVSALFVSSNKRKKIEIN
jgi:hypothetical protein